MLPIQDEIYPPDYYTPPATITSKEYVEKLHELQKRGDTAGVDEVLGLFADLKAGHDNAWEVMHALPTRDTEGYRDWLAWRVLAEAIQYFSRMWRHDALFLKYFEEYRSFVDEGIRSHKPWKMCWERTEEGDMNAA